MRKSDLVREIWIGRLNPGGPMYRVVGYIPRCLLPWTPPEVIAEYLDESPGRGGWHRVKDRGAITAVIQRATADVGPVDNHARPVLPSGRPVAVKVHGEREPRVAPAVAHDNQQGLTVPFRALGVRNG